MSRLDLKVVPFYAYVTDIMLPTFLLYNRMLQSAILAYS
jgi:hypothetical protein